MFSKCDAAWAVVPIENKLQKFPVTNGKQQRQRWKNQIESYAENISAANEKSSSLVNRQVYVIFAMRKN